MNRKTKNVSDPPEASRHMFETGFKERYDLEQYFWTEDTVQRLIKSLEFMPDCCCLTTPSLGVGFYQQGREEVVLDIDDRFAYLPRFRYFDIRYPTNTNLTENFRIIVMDPPFFYISMDQLYQAVMTITKDRTDIKLMIGFLKREEKALLEAFKAFNLRETNFPLEYATVRPNKWRNYALYSNIDLPGIKRK